MLRRTEPLRVVVDLFCGAGGFSLRSRAAGCEILAAADVDEATARTFELNFGRLQPLAPPVVLSGDEGNVEDLDLNRLVSRARPDILIGGPPCQGFSRVGRAKLDSLSMMGSPGIAPSAGGVTVKTTGTGRFSKHGVAHG